MNRSWALNNEWLYLFHRLGFFSFCVCFAVSWSVHQHWSDTTSPSKTPFLVTHVVNYSAKTRISFKKEKKSVTAVSTYWLRVTELCYCGRVTAGDFPELVHQSTLKWFLTVGHTSPETGGVEVLTLNESLFWIQNKQQGICSVISSLLRAVGFLTALSHT